MILEVADNLDVPQVLLVINKILPEFDLDALRKKAEDTYQKPVAGRLPFSSEMMRLGSQGIFCLQYPEHPVSEEFQRIVAHVGASV